MAPITYEQILIPNYWGPITSSIDWCEPNYKMTSFIAEPGNTISNLGFIVVGIVGALNEGINNSQKTYSILYSTIALIGIGSTCFHGTLTVWGQQLDELSMVWFMLMFCYVVNRDFIGTSALATTISAIGLPLYGIVFSVIHIVMQTTTAFQVHFGFLLLLILGRMYHRFQHTGPGKDGFTIIKLFFVFGSIGFANWLIDYNYCNELFLSQSRYPHGHVLWHIFMAYGAFYFVAMLRVLESQESGKALIVRYICGLPFVHRQGDKGGDVTATHTTKTQAHLGHVAGLLP